MLGVSRDADAKTIKKALYVLSVLFITSPLTSTFIYSSRKAAKIAHPDKGGSEAKMATLNEAYEVISNPELRARFDAGEDPNDPMAQQGGHPFAGHPFGGGGGFQYTYSQGGHGNPFGQFFQQQGGAQFRYSGH